MTELSPCAQAVLDAVKDHAKISSSSCRNLAAAALRAGADQTAWQLQIRRHLYAIADELETLHD